MKTRVLIRIKNGRDMDINVGEGGSVQGSYSVENLRKVLGEQPIRYDVVYTLAPKHGEFEVEYSGTYPRVGLIGSEDTWQVCQLPREWHGKFCSRKVYKGGK